ncbi:universal stress protein [Candidatus Providencia siddallii]|uniref:Universal stress protein n=1 Tax=Candidatus Providencia siddallii TaxID=1715285 RepID=A0ABM9NPK9_9GAMM
MYKTILLPIDITEKTLTNKAITHTINLAKLSNSKIHLIYVLPISLAITNTYTFGYSEIKDFTTKEAKKNIKKIIESINFPHNNISYTISFGIPRDEIINTAKNINADIIIIGSRHPNITTHLLGSTAASIVRYAKTSVLIIR